MNDAKFLGVKQYRGYSYCVEVSNERYYWYLLNDSEISIAHDREDIADSKAQDCIDNLIIEREGE